MNKPRGILIAGNWKMNLGLQETTEFLNTLSAHPWKRPSGKKAECWLIPNFIVLSRALSLARGLPFALEIAAQNAHGKTLGAYTGEISGKILQEAGIKQCLLGHSERRQFFGETDASVRERLTGLTEQGLEVLFCLGETLEERNAGLTTATLQRQLRVALSGTKLSPPLLRIAYEPVWAIGTGVTATCEQAQEAHALIRSELRGLLGDSVATRTQILYGGSVNPSNFNTLLQAPDVDGALIGGASLKADQFIQMIEIADSAL